MYELKSTVIFAGSKIKHWCTVEDKSEELLIEMQEKAHEIYHNATIHDTPSVIKIGSAVFRTQDLQYLNIRVRKLTQSENPLNDIHAS